MVGYIFCFDLGPGIYLFREYIHYNKNCILSIDSTKKNLSYKDNNNEITTISFNNIKGIIVYIPPNNYRDTVTFISMEDFSYARFELRNENEFYITCLMVPKGKLKDSIQDTFSNTVPIDFHRWWIFPSIRLVNYCRRNKKQESFS